MAHLRGRRQAAVRGGDVRPHLAALRPDELAHDRRPATTAGSAETARFTAAGLQGAALDVATGTGDLAFALSNCPGINRVVGVDLLSEMLAIAVDKPEATNTGRSPTAFVMGDALRLPFPDNAFVCATAGFSPAQHGRRAGGHRGDGPGGVPRRPRHHAGADAHAARHPRRPGPPVLPIDSCRSWVSWWPATAPPTPICPAAWTTSSPPRGLADVYRQAGLTKVGYRRLGLGGVALHYGEKIGLEVLVS